MAEHKHGEMDVAEHEQVFQGFVTWSARVAIVSIAALIFMALVNG